MKSEEGPFHWGLARRFAKRPGDLERRGLDRPYGKPWYHLRVSQIDSAVPRKVIGWMAGDVAVHGTKIVDSTGFSISRYRDWHNAKYRTISVKQFVKPRVARALGGMICAATVRRAGQTTRRICGRCWLGCRADPATCWQTPNTAESKTARTQGTADAAP